MSSPTRNASVLVVDDDPAVGTVLSAVFAQAGMQAKVVASGAEALAALEARPFDAVVSDVRMEGMDGMQLLDRVRQSWPELPVVMITAHGTVPLAVDAMRRGATDFVLKPFDREEILYVVDKALRGSAPAREAAPAPPADGSLVYRSDAMAEVLKLVDRVARSDATVLVLGETGTGKELVARAVHDRSSRPDGPFVKLHCAALPETLLESELFGYEKGAFTGAASRKPGRVELAHRGTLFLDEIGDVTPATQVKLLRLLQTREFERLGGTQTVQADVRFVAATHRDLEAMVARGEFREDLFYRLNVVPIWLPPLRERGDDVEALAHHFCAQYGAASERPTPVLDPEAIELLRGQAWPGNVRQLQNFVERLVLLSDGPSLDAADVRRELGRGPHGAPRPASAGEAGPPARGELEERRRQAEREAIVSALERTGGNRTAAARILGVSRRALYYKLEEHGLGGGPPA